MVSVVTTDQLVVFVNELELQSERKNWKSMKFQVSIETDD